MALRYRKPPRRGVYQRPDDETRAIAEKGRHGAAQAILAASKAFRSAVPVKAMAEKIAGRDLAGAADLVNVATLKHDLRAAFAALVAIHNESAKRAADAINEALTARRRRALRKDTSTFSGDPETPDRFAFDLYTDDVMAAIADYQDAFISAMTDDVRQTVFDAIAAGVKNGDEPSAIAASIRDVIGLNDRQAVAVENYRAALEQNIGASLDYALRDPSGDACARRPRDLDPRSRGFARARRRLRAVERRVAEVDEGREGEPRSAGAFQCGADVRGALNRRSC